MRWRWFVLALLLLCVAGVIVAGLAVTYRPTWYNPPVVDHAQIRRDKVAMLALQDQISAALNAGQPAAFAVDEAQFNRWLVARGEVWPELDRLPRGVTLPCARFQENQASCGVTVEKRVGRGVLSATVAVRLTDDEVVIDVQGLSLGAMPLPVSWLLERLPIDTHDAVALQRDAARGEIRLPNHWIWPNGKRPCKLNELRIHDGGVEVVIAPR